MMAEALPSNVSPHIVAPGGAIFFGSEPIGPLAYPWGPRLDGMSVWSTRTYGWLELGFDETYFRAALAHTGWKVVPQPTRDGDRATDVVVVRADPTWAG